MTTKSELRKKFKSIIDLRSDRTVTEKNNDAENFSQQLVSFFKLRQGSWGAFQPLRTEPPILTALSKISHIEWYFPRIKDELLEFSNGRDTRSHELGFSEPIDGDIKQAQELDGFIIPGLAFDRQGHRLGRGKGYYDRSLQHSKGLRVGICYQDQLVKKIEVVEKHDLSMSFIITENETVTCQSLAKGS